MVSRVGLLAEVALNTGPCWARGRTQVDKEETETQVEGSAAHPGHPWLSGHRFSGMPPALPHPILWSRYRLSLASEGPETHSLRDDETNEPSSTPQAPGRVLVGQKEVC